MSKFVVDAQLPKALSLFLNTSGHDSVHTLELKDANKTPDSILIEIAEKDKRIVITKDHDFQSSFFIRNKPSKLILVKTGNISNIALIELFEKNLKQMLNILKKNNFIEINTEEIIIHH